MKTTVHSGKDIEFQITLKNDGSEPAYDMLFSINTTVPLDLRKTKSEVNLEKETKNEKVYSKSGQWTLGIII